MDDMLVQVWNGIDHISFWQQGYQGVMVTDTAFYRYPHYHRASDTPEKLDYNRMNLPADIIKKLAADTARSRYQFRQLRLGRDKQVNKKSPRHKNTAQPETDRTAAEARKKAINCFFASGATCTKYFNLSFNSHFSFSFS